MNAKDKLRVEEEYRGQLARQLVAVDEARYLPCGHRAPDPVAGRPAPPSSECKWCLKETLAKRSPRYEDRPEPHPDDAIPYSQLEIMERFYERHPEKRPGGGLTERERDRLVEMLDQAREEELAREANERRRRESFDRPSVVYYAPGGMPCDASGRWY